ncbi:hypothetical protein M885DRAFT_497906 [Pelagophyceae sp. CCMP2097]|nr:hypothetical protein M885DRAFT_497906 [Pelagophyceae sp. CCMP2097]
MSGGASERAKSNLALACACAAAGMAQRALIACAAAEGDLDEADDEDNDAPDDAEALRAAIRCARAAALSLLGEHATAAAALRSAICLLSGRAASALPAAGAGATLADAWYNLGVSLLHLDDHTAAYVALFDGAKATAHLETVSAFRLRTEVRKRHSYYPESGAALWTKSATVEVQSCGPGIFRTQGLQTVVPESECSKLVAFAEAHALLRGGWSTARHGAVPTTDVAVCDLEPDAVALVNAWLEKALFPLLARLFCADVAKLRIHDAFVVRYDALGGQSELPVHQDQATFSVTLALNAAEDFQGGGVFFEASGSTLGCGVGHAVAFSSSLRHGGAPITEGRRYILALFVYLETDPTDSIRP